MAVASVAYNGKLMNAVKNFFSAIVDSKPFRWFIIFVIIASAVLVGLETYPGLHAEHAGTFRAVDIAIQAIFTVEILCRILAFGKKPFAFFKSANNVFDFVVTAVFYLPFGGSYAAIFRLVRIIRIFRLITALPHLQIVVGALMRSLSSLGYISLLLLIQMYVFAVIGVMLFGHHDPSRFGDVGNSLMTLFQVITLDNWSIIFNAQPRSFATVLYFVTYILSGTMIILNLFIGVIINGFDEMRTRLEFEKRAKRKTSSFDAELKQITNQLEDLRKRAALEQERSN